MSPTPVTPSVSNWPLVKIVIYEDGTGRVSIAGNHQDIEADDVSQARETALALVSQRAREMNRPLRAWTSDPSGQWPLIVHTTGEVEQDPSRPAEPKDEEEPEMPAELLHEPDQPEDHHEHNGTTALTERQESTTSSSELAPASADTPQIETRRERRAQRESFLTQEEVIEPATQGWRGWLANLGIRMSPSEAEKSERADRRAVSQHWPGPRTIAIVNGKGGANKTPTTAELSAVFARYGGGGVLAWDNNQTRGTLGWRTEQGPHDATILDLLPQSAGLLAPGAQSADLAHYVHHQTSDRYDVLRSKAMVLADEQRIQASDVDAIHQVSSKFYRLIFIDSGNDESDELWKRMVDRADQIVVATTTKDDHAEAGALLLEALAERDDRSARLADEAVVIVSQAESTVPTTTVEKVRSDFAAISREAVTIPFDPALVRGVLRYYTLRPTTQRAWLRAAAAVAKGL